MATKRKQSKPRAKTILRPKDRDPSEPDADDAQGAAANTVAGAGMPQAGGPPGMAPSMADMLMQMARRRV